MTGADDSIPRQPARPRGRLARCRPGTRLRRAALVLVLAGSVWAQFTGSGVVKGPFTFPEYDKQNRLRSLLVGMGARPQLDGRVAMEQLHLQTYTEDGLTNLVIVGTNCVFNPQTHLAWSPDRLRVRSADGRFVIEGVGFLWRQTDSHLTISNQVHIWLHNFQPANTRTNS